MLGRNSSLQQIMHTQGIKKEYLEKLQRVGGICMGGEGRRLGKSQSLGEIRKRNASNEGGGLVRNEASKKSCLKLNEEAVREEKNEQTGKRVRFNPELDVSHGSKITANAIISAVRKENTSLPEIFNKKQLYTKLDDNFGFERNNRFYVKNFVSPDNFIVNRRKLRRLEMPNLSSK